MKHTIYCFVVMDYGEYLYSIALSEDGYMLTSHISTNRSFAMTDMGWNNNNDKHQQYKEHYPDGYNVAWVDDPEDHRGVQEAIRLNKELGEKSKLSKENTAGVTITYEPKEEQTDEN